ncbi:MAG: cell division protein FtsL [Betaproteobacteria bacterium]
MTRLNVLILAMVMFTAFYLVRTQYESRRLYTEFDHARSEGRKIELEKERLEVERRYQGTSLRVEKVAKEQLHMKSVTPAITQYVLNPVELQEAQVREAKLDVNAHANGKIQIKVTPQLSTPVLANAGVLSP